MKKQPPEYYKETIKHASMYLEHGKKEEARNLVELLNNVDKISGVAAIKYLTKQYGRF